MKLWRCELHLLLVLLDVLSLDGFRGGGGFRKGGHKPRAEPPACFYAIAVLRARSLSELSLQALPASWRDLIQCLRDSYFPRVGMRMLRGGDNGNVWGDNTVMSVLHHRPGISECQKGVKCKTHRWVE